MTAFKKIARVFHRSIDLILYIFRPIVSRGRWFICVVGILLVFMMGQSITALLIEIPGQHQVEVLRGIFVDSSRGHSKTGKFPIALVDNAGKTHTCNCEALSNSNCLDAAISRDPSIAALLSRTDYKDGVHIALLRRLNGRHGEIWVYPSRTLVGMRYACYQVADESMTYLKFSDSVISYENAKRSVGVFAVGAAALLTLVASGLYTLFRVHSSLFRSE